MNVPLDVERYILEYIPSEWLTIDSRLYLGKDPERLEDFENPSLLRHRPRWVSGGMWDHDSDRRCHALLLYVKKTEEDPRWKTLVYMYTLDYDFIKVLKLPFYVPQYEFYTSSRHRRVLPW